MLRNFEVLSYFGLDSVIYQLLGHNLDAERSAMLVAAPLVNGTWDPNPNDYSLYTIYTGAHEGTFFDPSTYADFNPAVPANNHVNLAQSLSKHSTYGFNPDYYPITPAWFIASTNAANTAAWQAGEYDTDTYLLIAAMANDTFYGCLVERFGDQGVQAPNPRTNVGEVAAPINNSHFIQDNSDAALHLADKLTQPIF